MARHVGNTKRYTVPKKTQNKILPIVCFCAVFLLGMFAGKLEVMTYTGMFAWASFFPQFLGKAIYFVVTLPVALPGYFGFGLMQYVSWNRLVLVGVASFLWAFVFWIFMGIFRR